MSLAGVARVVADNLDHIATSRMTCGRRKASIKAQAAMLREAIEASEAPTGVMIVQQDRRYRFGAAHCPDCGADWSRTELVSEASRGGGYRVRCHDCGHEWDDSNASHGERETLRRKGLG